MVLLVDDDRIAREALIEILTVLNHQVIGAENGVEALEILADRASEIDVVLTDYLMPKMGGQELCREVAFRYPQIKLVLMTGYPRYGATTELFGPEVTRIQKPMSLDTIKQAVSLRSV